MIYYRKVILICQDNTCRSIMAEAIMKNVVNSLPAEQRFQVGSRGLVVLFPEPLNPKAVEIIEAHHMQVLKTASTPFEADDVVEGTLYMTMTNKEKEVLQERYPKIENLYTLREFAGEAGDIIEPYGGTDEDYLMVYEHIDLMVKLATEKLVGDSRNRMEDMEDDSNWQ